MPTIAIIGAGPRLTLSAAKLFGRKGFQVGLVARNQDNLKSLTAVLTSEGVQAAGFVGDVTDPASMQVAVKAITERFGPVDVLLFSPVSKTLAPGNGVFGALEVTVGNVQEQLDIQLHGAITSVQQVLPAMLERADGTLLFTTSYAAVQPMAFAANFGIASAALRYYAATLHDALADKGVHAAHISINVYFDTGPGTEPDTIAELYWRAYTRREQAEHLYQP